jgi:hypothetical protein
MSNEVQDRPAPLRRIEIPGDTLIPDEEFCDEVLAGATRRTSQRYDAKGLPFAMIGGIKWRPIGEGRAWVAARIQRLGQPPKRQRA